jgi:DNA-3-methyladenine glycosylase
MNMKILDRQFYERKTEKVARDLLGKILARKGKEGATSGIIVETEAYYGENDPASRASKGRTKLNEIMWGKAGVAFVYMVHANWLFNVVTEPEGVAGAVLVRAVEPVEGIELMKLRRGVENFKELTSGPGKLTEAFGITKTHHGLDLTKWTSEVFIAEGGKRDFSVARSHRIGVTADLKRKLRFYAAGNPFVSK